MSGYPFTNHTHQHDKALAAVVTLTLESRLTSDVINTFRNVIPNVTAYFQDTILQYQTKDETDFNFQKASRNFGKVEQALRDVNFALIGRTPVQAPEGFTGEYVPYLEWLDTKAIVLIEEANQVLLDYYTELSIFISNKDARLVMKNTAHQTRHMQKRLDDIHQGLTSFFDSRTSNALRPMDTLFERGADVRRSMDLAEAINKKRLKFDNKDILGLTKKIAELLNLLIESTETDKIPEVSGQVATSLAQGAMVAARYVEMAGVLRYRIEEALSCVCICVEQVDGAIKNHAKAL